MKTTIQNLKELGIKVEYEDREERLKQTKKLEDMNEEIRNRTSFNRIRRTNRSKIPTARCLQIGNDRTGATFKTNIWR